MIIALLIVIVLLLILIIKWLRVINSNAIAIGNMHKEFYIQAINSQKEGKK